MCSSLYEYYQRVNRERLILSVTGPISQEIVTQYGSMLKSMDSISENRRVGVLGVFVELAQNVLRYSAEKTGSVGLGVVIISEDETRFRVSSGNLIREEARHGIEDSFGRLSKLSYDELRATYREKRKEARDGDGEGAGLGLIELFKRCSRVGCEFEKVEGGGLFLTISAEIPKE